MGRFLLLFACLALVASPAAAQNQTRWSTYDVPSATGGGICPLVDNATGNYFCFSLACGSGNPLQYEMAFAGAGFDESDAQVRVIVDGRALAQLTMPRVTEQSEFVYRTPVVLDRDAGLLAALRSGRTGRIEFSVGGQPGRGRDFSLAGSSRALDFAFSRCELAPPPPPPAVADPAARVRAELTAECTESGQVASFDDTFIELRDIDLDGREDLFLNYGAYRCGDYGLMYCGSAGCATDIWWQTPAGDYTLVTNSYFYEISTETVPVTTMRTHGSACGQVGVDNCLLRFTWDNGKLVRMAE